MRKKKSELKEILESYEEVIVALRDCGKKGKDCATCEDHAERHIYLRECISLVMEWIVLYTKSSGKDFIRSFIKLGKEMENKKEDVQYFV